MEKRTRAETIGELIFNLIMSCNCSKYQPIELDRKSISRRTKESRSIKQQLKLLAENLESNLQLFECSVCGQLWQNGREWNFANQEYLFQVPKIDVEVWKREPFAQPAAMMIYSAMMENYCARTTFETGDSKCRVENCTNRALRFSVFCKDHHIEELQRIKTLPKKPSGKMFPPYHVKAKESI
jgi:hypothetical protein